MAVAFPFSVITSKPGAAITKLQSQLDKVIDQLNKKVTEAISKSGKLPTNINCNDPRILEIKRILSQIQTYIDQIRTILNILNIVIPILTTAAQIASVIINAQVATPVPAPPAASQGLAVQNELVANIASALKQASIIITIVNGSVMLSSKLLAGVINKLSSICNTETFEVSKITQDAIDTINNQVVNDNITSEFYRLINVSQSDLDNRNILIADLELQQRLLLTDLLEAPSKVYQNQGAPANDLGKLGDYYIDLDTQTVYGPKLSINNW
jgi:hypothetical protein